MVHRYCCVSFRPTLALSEWCLGERCTLNRAEVGSDGLQWLDLELDIFCSPVVAFDLSHTCTLDDASPFRIRDVIGVSMSDIA